MIDIRFKLYWWFYIWDATDNALSFLKTSGGDSQVGFRHLIPEFRLSLDITMAGIVIRYGDIDVYGVLRRKMFIF